MASAIGCSHMRLQVLHWSQQLASAASQPSDARAAFSNSPLHLRSIRKLVSCEVSSTSEAASSSSSSEPKWKQKLAAADRHQERTRQLTAEAQLEYQKKQQALRNQQLQLQSEPLKDLPFIPFLNEEGKFSDCSSPEAKATVYAIFDGDHMLQYIGVSRQVYQSMRLHFARMPRCCHFVKVKHISKPSRAVLEGIREQWLAEWQAEHGSRPQGNDGGEVQNRWENPLDCKPLMTAAEKEAVATAAPGPPKAKAMKAAARRVEAELEEGYKAMGCTEVLRFDPKLKETGMLDLKAVAPDTSVPKTEPAKATSKA